MAEHTVRPKSSMGTTTIPLRRSQAHARRLPMRRAAQQSHKERRTSAYVVVIERNLGRSLLTYLQTVRRWRA